MTTPNDQVSERTNTTQCTSELEFALLQTSFEECIPFATLLRSLDGRMISYLNRLVAGGRARGDSSGAINRQVRDSIRTNVLFFVLDLVEPENPTDTDSYSQSQSRQGSGALDVLEEMDAQGFEVDQPYSPEQNHQEQADSEYRSLDRTHQARRPSSSRPKAIGLQPVAKGDKCECTTCFKTRKLFSRSASR